MNPVPNNQPSDKPDETEHHPKLNEWLNNQKSLTRKKALTIIVPAYNEARRLPPTLIDIIDFFDAQTIDYEVLVVDDGSDDETSAVIKKFEKIRSQVRAIRLPKNYGKGHAVRTGALNAEGDLILFTDADGSTPIEEFSRLMESMNNGADIAIGSRAMSSEDTKVSTRWYRKAMGRVFNGIVNLFLIPDISDTQCGFKLFTHDVAQFLFRKQQSDGFSFDIELLCLARKCDLKVAEVPVNWTNVPGSKVNLLVDSLKMFLDIFRFALLHKEVSPQNYKDFLSSKSSKQGD